MHNCTSVIISKGVFFAIARTHHQNHRKASTNVHLLLNKIFICFQCGGMLISTMFTALPEPLAMTLQFVLFWFSWLLQGVFYSFLNSFLLTATSSFYQFFLFFFLLFTRCSCCIISSEGALVAIPLPLFHITSSRTSKAHYNLLTHFKIFEHLCQ